MSSLSNISTQCHLIPFCIAFTDAENDAGLSFLHYFNAHILRLSLEGGELHIEHRNNNTYTRSIPNLSTH